MKIKARINCLIFACMMFSVLNDANALGRVSRACQFSSLSSELKPLAAAFFFALGADADILVLPSQSNDYQQTKWILEALTTDYGSPRYLLFATRIIYFANLTIDSTVTYYRMRSLDLSSQWTSQQISDAMKADPKFSYYYLNRGILSSARAGNPKIVETLDYSYLGYGSQQFMVVGYHWYYDPVGKRVVRLADTQTNSCNLPDIGYGTGLFDR